jgi:hypothetical protein
MLMIHAGSALVGTDTLDQLPAPVSRGPMHQPVPHGVLVQAMERAALAHGYVVTRQELAIGHTGRRLFGVMDLEPPAGVARDNARGFAIGFRNSTDMTLGIRLVAGARVSVCDNLMLSGDLIALKRKNTTHLDLDSSLEEGFDRYLQHARVLDLQIATLQDAVLTPEEAKVSIFEIFAHHVLPMRLFERVVQNYFDPDTTMTDCLPRTQWGLHNACTRAVKVLSPVRAFAANVDLGRLFGLTQKIVH